jgi:hypothetical protein
MTEKWVADPGIGWRILLTAHLDAAPDPGLLLDRLSDVFTRQGWPGAAEVRTDDDVEELRLRLVDAATPVLLGLAGSSLVISARHASVDGLGLLAVLSEVTGRPASSRVRGVADRPLRGGAAGTTGRRLAEAVFRPPAGIDSPGAGGGGDVFAEVRVPGALRTAALVHAAVQGVVAHNAAAGRRTRRVVVAVGAGRPGADNDRIADNSALLRLTNLESRSAAEIADLLAAAPLEPAPAARGAATARLMRGGIRMLARRLGSTLLVSHLGEVTANGVTGLAFHPVTAGGTGVALGAVTLRGSTTLTLRARAARWDRAGLQRLLDAIASELDS